MGCKHHFVYTQGHFYCTKCGKRTYGKTHKKRQGKKIGIGITIFVIVGFVGFLFINGVFEINQEKLEESIQEIPKNIPELPPIPAIPEEISKSIENIVEESSEHMNKINENVAELSKPQKTSEEQAQSAIEYINTLRAQNGKNSISHDSRVFQVAMARAIDMYEYDYHDHTNPITGTCPYNIKSNFGLKSNENVAENGHLTTVNGAPSLYNPSLNQVIDGWMQSTGHRMNLLHYLHISGSVACYGGYCVFLGLNHGNFGEGCYTAAEGQEHAKRFKNCTSEQMQEYDNLNKEYDKIPQQTTSQAQYQRAMQLYNQIINFEC